MTDTYFGDKVITDDDTYLDDDKTTRLHKDGNDLIIQVKVGDSWVDQAKLGS